MEQNFKCVIYSHTPRYFKGSNHHKVNNDIKSYELLFDNVALFINDKKNQKEKQNINRGNIN